MSRAACGDRPSCSAEPRAGNNQEAAAALPPRGRCGRQVRAPDCPVPGTLRSGGRLSLGTSPPCLLTSCPPAEASGSSSAPTPKVSPSLGFVRQSCPSARREPECARSTAGCAVRAPLSLPPAEAVAALSAWEFHLNRLYSPLAQFLCPLTSLRTPGVAPPARNPISCPPARVTPSGRVRNVRGGSRCFSKLHPATTATLPLRGFLRGSRKRR